MPYSNSRRARYLRARAAALSRSRAVAARSSRSARMNYMSKLRRYNKLPSVYRFKEKCQLIDYMVPAGATGSGPGVLAGVQSFKMSDIFNFTNFQNLFDLYKITGVKLLIVPEFNMSDIAFAGTSSGTPGGQLPLLYISPNRDPYVPAPASVLDILNDDGVKIIRATKPITLNIKFPKPQVLDSGGQDVPMQFNVGTQPWLTTGGNSQTINQSSVKHFGFRYWIENNAANIVNFRVFATYYFVMKEQD